ncbi:MAG: Tab2/Atab2 family RNA-binding protein [Cyanobacteria bacterium P01_F01_bin.150]
MGEADWLHGTETDMVIWQVDFYRRPLQDESKNPLWELAICSADKSFAAYGFCPQSDANAAWLTSQFKALLAEGKCPDSIQVFRPQSQSLIQAAVEQFDIRVIPTRRTPALKEYLQDRAAIYPTLPQYDPIQGMDYQPIAIESPPPVPIPDALWGDRWRFGAMKAGDLEPFFRDKPIPVLDIPSHLSPMQLGLSSEVNIPGVVIDGGRQSMRLAQWLREQQPVALNYISGAPDGLILDVGLCDRFILATFDDGDMREAAIAYQRKLDYSNGLHFLLIQPDNSGMTYTGMWLLRPEPS